MEFKKTNEILDILGISEYEKNLVLGVVKNEIAINDLDYKEKNLRKSMKKLRRKSPKRK